MHCHNKLLEARLRNRQYGFLMAQPDASQPESGERTTTDGDPLYNGHVYRSTSMKDQPAVEICRTVGMRKPTPKKRGSKIGFIIDPFRLREVWFESGLEENWATVLIARTDVEEVREQQTVNYGSGRAHTIDFVVKWKSGFRTAYAVKYAADVDQRLRHILQAVADRHGDDVADDFCILTEEELDSTTIANSREVLSCSTDFDFEGQHIIRKYLAEAGRQVRLGDIGKQSKLGYRGYRAAIALLHEGALVADPSELLRDDLVVTNHLSVDVPKAKASATLIQSSNE